MGADIELVRRGIGSDPRIGTHFLYPGAGYGGSCFPKDVKALIHTGRENGVELGVLRAVETANDAQKRVLVNKIVARFGENLAGYTFALWGLAFKPNTDDMREAPSRVVIAELGRRGAAIQAYDPAAMSQARQLLEGTPRLTFMQGQRQCLEDADALIILTEWTEFRNPDFDHIKATLREPQVFDGRNLYEPSFMKTMGIECVAIRRPH